MTRSAGQGVGTFIFTAGLLLNLGFTSHAQTALEPTPVQVLPLIAPEAAPQHGTFWSWQKQDIEPPLPFNPFPLLPLYAIGTNTYTYDDSAVDYVTLREDVKLHWTLKQLEAESGLETPVVPELGIYGESGGIFLMESEGPPSPPGAGGSGTNGPGIGSSEAYNYPTNTL